jgi:hypothetical protein
MIMRIPWISLFAVAALALIVLLMAAQFGPSALGAGTLEVFDFG